MYRTTDQELSDQHVRNARALGHTDECQMAVGLWVTKDGVRVNWPTLLGRPVCTCGRKER